jgi:hypothetical protein
MESPPRLPWQQVNNVLLYHGKYLRNHQVACLALFIDTCCYKEKNYPILFLKLVYCIAKVYRIFSNIYCCVPHYTRLLILFLCDKCRCSLFCIGNLSAMRSSVIGSYWGPGFISMPEISSSIMMAALFLAMSYYRHIVHHAFYWILVS